MRIRRSLIIATFASVGVAVAHAPQASASCSLVITIGDSFASGTGIHDDDGGYDVVGGGAAVAGPLTGRQDAECWREDDTAAGPLVANALGAGSTFLPCKGAEAAHVNNQWTLAMAGDPGRVASGFAETLILVTAGGNDVRTAGGETWPKVIEHCMLRSKCHLDGLGIANLPTIQTRVSNLLGRIAATAPNATIRLVGYPYIMKPNPDCDVLNNLGVGITTDEARWIDSQADLLNAALMGSVAAIRAFSPKVNIQFVDVRPFVHTGACERNGHINGLVMNGLNPSDASFHPSQAGHYSMMSAILRSIGVDPTIYQPPVGNPCPPDGDDELATSAGDAAGSASPDGDTRYDDAVESTNAETSRPERAGDPTDKPSDGDVAAAPRGEDPPADAAPAPCDP